MLAMIWMVKGSNLCWVKLGVCSTSVIVVLETKISDICKRSMTYMVQGQVIEQKDNHQHSCINVYVDKQ